MDAAFIRPPGVKPFPWKRPRADPGNGEGKGKEVSRGKTENLHLFTEKTDLEQQHVFEERQTNAYHEGGQMFTAV